MSALSVFSFSEKLPVRVSVVDDEPWFVAKDVAQCLEYSQASISQPSNLFRAVPDQWKAFQEFETRGGKQKILSLSEQGLYFFLGRSDKPKALPFQMWLAGDVLPTIRKTGQYSAGDNTLKSTATLTPAQQLLVRQAVASRAKTESKHYHTIYRAIYNRFQIARYDQLHQSDLNECLKFIQEVDLRVPEVRTQPAPVPAPVTNSNGLQTVDGPNGQIILLSHTDLERLRSFVYYYNYLFRREMELFYEFLNRMKSPYAPRFYESITSPSLVSVERILDKVGYPVKELDCYKSWASHQ